MSPVQTLFLIIRSSFFNEPLPFTQLSHQEYRRLMYVASRQTIEGIVAGVLMRSNIQLDREDALHVFSVNKSIEQSNHRVNAVIVRLSSILKKNNLDYIVFKGQTFSKIYPRPLERVPGDIDFFCGKEYFEEAKTVLEKEWGVTFSGSESEQHLEFKYGQVPLEMHYNMIKFNHRQIQKYWDNILKSANKDSLTIEGCQVATLEPTLNVLYTFLHLYHHLVELGVGLRQFCDVLCLLHSYHQVIDKKSLEKHLVTMGFMRAFCAIGWVLIHQMGLPINEFPFKIQERDKKKEKDILDIVLRGGNFGKYISSTPVRSGMKYNIEATFRKFRHYYLFWNLSSKEIRATILKEIPKKICFALRLHGLNKKYKR